ncbi:PREDICTED: importin subunit alpha-8-like [Camelina sativa]|uniref:Importin subunit alpha-8-like n=1 Tax=Camelina sativa TaxID=90675 RepID=A0ABM1QLH1_CAMSA|nr:PREDICTED: importin subunit alpha-8-like [Camelina sativa]
MFSEIACFLDGFYSNDRSRQLESAAKIKEFLLKNMPEIGPFDTQRLTYYGVIRRFVGFLHMKDSPELPCLAAEALSIVAAIKPNLVVDQDPGPKLVKLIASPYIRDPALLALANVAADPVHHDYLLKSGALMPLLNLLSKDTTTLSTLRAATLTLCNLCRGNPPPTFEQVFLPISLFPLFVYIQNLNFNI